MSAAKLSYVVQKLIIRTLKRSRSFCKKGKIRILEPCARKNVVLEFGNYEWEGLIMSNFFWGDLSIYQDRYVLTKTNVSWI